MKKLLLFMSILVLTINTIGCSVNPIRAELREDAKMTYEFLSEQETKIKNNTAISIEQEYVDNKVKEIKEAILYKYEYDDLNKTEAFLKTKLIEAMIVYIDVIIGIWENDLSDQWLGDLFKFYDVMNDLHEMEIGNL